MRRTSGSCPTCYYYTMIWLCVLNSRLIRAKGNIFSYFVTYLLITFASHIYSSTYVEDGRCESDVEKARVRRIHVYEPDSKFTRHAGLKYSRVRFGLSASHWSTDLSLKRIRVNTTRVWTKLIWFSEFLKNNDLKNFIISNDVLYINLVTWPLFVNHLNGNSSIYGIPQLTAIKGNYNRSK